MIYKFQYSNDEERESLIKEHSDKNLTEEQNLADGNYLIFSDKKFPEGTLLETIRKIRIDEMNTECSKRILSGFVSKAFDGVTEKHYDCEMTDQSRISGLVSIAQLRVLNLSTEPIKWKATGELECYEWTPVQMLELGLDLKRHIEANTDRFYALRVYALDDNRTKDELEAITWDMDLPR